METDNNARTVYTVAVEEECEVILTIEELAIASQVLAKRYQERGELLIELKRVHGKMKSEIDLFDKQIGEIVTRVSNGYDKRWIPCTVMMDFPLIGKKVCTRDDTGEQIWEREMTREDRQLELSLGGEPQEADDTETIEATKEAEESPDVNEFTDTKNAELVAEGEAIIKKNKSDKSKEEEC
jgi:hypothetical protein